MRITRRGALVHLAVGLLALLALAAPVGAGGWAAVELDEPIVQVPIGVPVTIGFTVLQHGVTPNGDVSPYLLATHRASGDELRADARADGEFGHFVVEVTFPEGGEWKWRIVPKPFGPTSFPTVTALTADQLAAGPDLPAVPEEEVIHPAEIVRGGCGPDAALAYALTEVAPLTAPTAETTDAPVVKESETVLPVALSDLAAATHAIAVRAGDAPDAEIVACGAILGDPLSGEVIIGLTEQGDSGYVGFARLSDAGGQTTVTIYLARELSTGTGSAIPISIDDSGFSPLRVRITVGSTVTWTNSGSVVHTVTADNLDFDDSGVLHPGESFTQTFDTPGTYTCLCGPHPSMTGTIEVV